jgi:hypothetical protein
MRIAPCRVSFQFANNNRIGGAYASLSISLGDEAKQWEISGETNWENTRPTLDLVLNIPYNVG